MNLAPRPTRASTLVAIVTFSALAALTACRAAPSGASPAAASTTTAQRTTPATVAAGPTDADAQAFLAATFGHAASLHAAWTGAQHETQRVCADARIEDATGPQRLLAVCTALPTQDVETTGRIDLFALGLQNGKRSVVAASRGLKHGFRGDPGQVRVVRIGRSRYAFELAYATFDEEGTLQQRAWYLARDGRFELALTMPARYTSDGRAWCRYAETTTCEGQATDLTYELRVDERTADADAYPVTVTVQGTRCDRAVAPATQTLAFDPHMSTYAVPPAARKPATDCRSISTSSSAQD